MYSFVYLQALSANADQGQTVVSDFDEGGGLFAVEIGGMGRDARQCKAKTTAMPEFTF